MCCVILAAASCSTDPLTQIVVVIDADSTEWDRVEVRVDGFAEPAVVHVDLAEKPLPRRFSLVHEGGALGPIAVTASAYRTGNAEPALVEPRTGIFFVSSKTQLLRIALFHACVDACAAGMACVEGGRCVSSDAAAVLQPWTGEAPPLSLGGMGLDGDAMIGPGGAVPDAGSTAGAGGGVAPGVDAGPPPPLWSYTPSNFDAVDVMTGLPGGIRVRLDCGESTFDSTKLAFDHFCGIEPGVKVVSQHDGGEAVALVMDSLTIAQGASLTLSGNRPVIFAVYGDADIAGLVDASGATGTDGPGAGRACADAAGSSGGESPGGNAGSGGGSGGGFGSAGGPGGSNGANSTRVDGGQTAGNAALVPLRGGCPGGKGGGRLPGSVVGFGGGGGGAVQISARGKLKIDGTIAAPGGGGGVGEQVKDGGGGGGSGGGILLEGSPVVVGPDAFVTANGGGGGGGQPQSGAVGAQPGASGATLGSSPAAGGMGAGSGGDGGSGAALSADPTGGADPSATSLFPDYGGGGGGGGGVGRIRVNGATECVPGGSFSPVPFVVCPTCGVCPVAPKAGCLPAAHEGAFYFSCAQGLNWNDAVATCVGAGMHLVHIDSEDEDAWLQDLLDADAWIGATDQESEGVWRWSDDGAQFWMGRSSGSATGGSYAHWAGGEPSDFFSTENCARLAADGWSDTGCEDSLPYVCEQ